MLGARTAQAFRAGRAREGAARDRGGAADRRDLRRRARDQRPAASSSATPSGRRSRRWSRRTRGLDARANAARCRGTPMSPRPWTTCSSAGPAFTRFLDDGRICLTNNAAERALRGIALGRKAWLFAGSDRGGERAAAMYSLIVTAKTQRRRSAGLARRRPRPHRRPPRPAPGRAAALELARTRSEPPPLPEPSRRGTHRMDTEQDRVGIEKMKANDVGPRGYQPSRRGSTLDM